MIGLLKAAAKGLGNMAKSINKADPELEQLGKLDAAHKARAKELLDKEESVKQANIELGMKNNKGANMDSQMRHAETQHDKTIRDALVATRAKSELRNRMGE